MFQSLKDNWLLLAPPFLGFVALYLLVPRARRITPIWGGCAAALALILGAWLFIRNETVWEESLLFYAFAGIAIIGGGMMITQSNPVHAALSFALVVLSTCGLFLLQAAPFLMAATIIIYAGAIVVTFLFVIMLAQQEGVSDADQRSREPFLACLAGCVLMASLLCVLERTYDTRELDAILPQLKALSEAKDADAIKAILGDPREVPPLVISLKKQFSEGSICESADNLQHQWVKKDTQSVVTTAKALQKAVAAKRQEHGTLALEDVPGKSNTPGHSLQPGKLPAANVAALGRTLFTDYLIPVELAATLLLVATIGAIVIAGRKRAEELR